MDEASEGDKAEGSYIDDKGLKGETKPKDVTDKLVSDAQKP